MKVRLLVLSSLLIISMRLSAAMKVQKKATLTTEEQKHLNRQLVDAVNAVDMNAVRELLSKGLEANISTMTFKVHAPYEVVMNVFERLEENTDQAIAQANNDIDRSELKKTISSFRSILEQAILDQQLIRATKDGNAHLVRELLKKGAQIISFKWDNRRPFQLRFSQPVSFEWAAILGHTEIMNINLDALSDKRGYEYNRQEELREVRLYRQLIVPLFERDVRSLEGQIQCIEGIVRYCKSCSSEKAYKVIERITELIKAFLSRDIIFTFFSSHNDALRLSLEAIGAQQLTHAPDALLVNRISKQEHLDRLLLLAAREDDELVKVLIDEGADVTTCDWHGCTALHHAAHAENIRAARILLRAGAPIDAKCVYGQTPLYINGSLIRPGVAKLLLESGATLEDNCTHMNASPETQAAIKTVLEAGVKRFAPTKIQAKIAMQNVAFLIYVFSIKLNLPYYVIHEIILFATGEMKNAQAPEWTQRLKRDLEVLYLYKCNGNRLFPLWEQTMRCIAKDPQEQARLLSKLGNYLEPFLANDTKRFVCLNIMNKVAEGKRIILTGANHAKNNKQQILVDNFKLYYDHLDRYLQMSGFDEE